ncbi:hypothetical protein CERZMDRAFT_42302 [Cercospora zeae-maydis SCOH1-5]|uniref:AB hydrolase-1 domain-containing protein n=1 Tax=Cercospora zeae-maydis SCOH1-5 TaxID=717836 RepID=A0A6A6FEG8_9PEZI|nr:hypothetical protein CERZMDRAFT_42302 [Cercospora zeae-maydis SCOH1-5]
MAAARISALLSTGYGVLYLVAALAYTVTQKTFWQGFNKEKRARLARASRNLWSLQEGLDGIRQKFLKLKNGTQLHYLEATPPTAPESKSLVIFMHGYPDSCHLWSRYLRSSSLITHAKLVALDLPGCGGSDSLDRYGPEQVLNAIAEAITLLKDRYLPRDQASSGTPSPQCILVAHDWGGIITFRLAAQTIGLFDHFIAINAIFRSHGIAYEKFPKPSPEEKATRLALACGPGAAEAELPADDGSMYGPSVYERSVRYNVPGHWDGRIKLYTQGLLRQKWTPDYPGFSSAMPLPDKSGHTTEDNKRLKYPVTCIFGMGDIALNPRIMLDGIEDFFLPSSDGVRESKIVRVAKGGHWCLIEPEGEEVVQAELQWALRGGKA